MRTLSPTLRTLLGSQSVDWHLKAEVKDTDGVWQDLTALAGKDWVMAADLSADIDSLTMSGTVTLWRDGESATESLSPLRGDSTLNRNAASAFAPLLNAGRRIRISTAPTAHGVAPTSGDWIEMVVGKIDSVPLAANPIVISYRDMGAYLLDATIEEPRAYGAENGTLMETVMQAILDDTLGAGAVTLSTPSSPIAYVRPYQQAAGVSPMDALHSLAMQIGRDVRYSYQGGDTLLLTFGEPDRAKTTPDATFGPGEYLTIDALDINDADVRNVVRVKYVDAATGLVASVTRSAAGSIAEFGRRYMEIGEGSTSNIDSPNEAAAMADAAISDLSEPFATHQVGMFGFPHVELGDLYTFLANGVHYDEDQTVAVGSFRHTWSGGSMRTSLTMRGHPAGAYRRWLELRGGAITEPISRGPVPLIGPIGGESSAFGGGANREGMIWLAVRFTKETERIEIYAVESATSPVDLPELSESRKAWTVRRQDGDVASADDWASYIMVATRTDYYRKLVALPIGYDGQRGPVTILEAHATDSGTGPAAAPGAVTRTVDGDTNVVSFTVNDGASDHLIFRNGFVIARIAAGEVSTGGTAEFRDTHVDTGVAYTYDTCAFRSFQTSAFGGGGTQPPISGATGAPQWADGYPQATVVDGAPACIFSWIADASTVEIWVEGQPFGDYSIITNGNPWYRLGDVYSGAGSIPTGSFTNIGTVPGATQQVRLASRFPDGTVLYSAQVTALWGEPPVQSAPFAKPQWDGAVPYYDSAGDLRTHYAWSVIDSRCTRIDVEKLVGSTWTAIDGSMAASTIASGSGSVAGSLVGTQLRLKATYPGSVVTYSLARYPTPVAPT